MVLSEQSGNTHYAPGPPEEPGLLLAQDLLAELQRAADDPLQIQQGRAAQELFMGLGVPLSRVLQGPNAHKAIALLQEMVSADVSDDPGFAHDERITARHIKATGANMVLSMLTNEVVACAEDRADPMLADTAQALLFDAFAVSPERANSTAVQFLAKKLPDIVREAVTDAENDPRTMSHLQYSDEDDPVTVELFPKIVRVTDQFDYIAQHAAAADRPAICALLQEIAEKAPTSPYWQAIAEEVYEEDQALGTLCSLMGLPENDLYITWGIGYGRSKRADHASRMTPSEYRQACLRRMVSLEAQEPGICNYLYRYHGIRNFGRFPEALLLSQYRNRSKSYQERMYFLSGTDDDNGSAVYNSMPKIHQAITQLEAHGVGGIVVEVNKKHELKVRARLARMAGWEPARYVFVDAHGDYGEVGFGELTTVQDITNWLGSLIIEATAPDGTVIINSCRGASSTHPKSPSYAETAHTVSGREIQGTRAGTWLKSLEVYTDVAGAPHIAADIRYSKKWETTPGDPVITFGGQPRAARTPSKPTGTYPSGNRDSRHMDQTVEQLTAGVRAAIAAIPTANLEAAAKIIHDQHLDFTILSQDTYTGSPLEQSAIPIGEAADTLDNALARMRKATRQLQAYLRDITG